MDALKRKLEHAITVWDRKQSNPFAGAIALRRLDDALADHAAGYSVARALYDNFNDRLLTELERPAGVADRGRPWPARLK